MSFNHFRPCRKSEQGQSAEFRTGIAVRVYRGYQNREPGEAVSGFPFFRVLAYEMLIGYQDTRSCLLRVTARTGMLIGYASTRF